MAGKQYFLLFLQMVWVAADGSWPQRSPYSLQAAVDELHRREAAKYPLNVPPSSQQQQHYFGGGANNEQDYWDDDTDFPATNSNKNRNRHRLNKALGKYLERENYDSGLGLGPFGGYEFDEDSNNLFPSYVDEKKRSSYFRERDNKYDNLPSSVFRERESQASSSNGGAEHAELTDQFLREIEETQEHEREDRYKEALRHLWEKYQQQENEIEGNLFEEKKRMRMPPYYMLMQKKRSSYPVLPWLPYSDRKKRFPVSKRSTKRSSNDNPNLGKTDEKVARELSELFGTPSDHEDEEKKKRSTDEQTQVSSTHTPDASSTALSDMHLDGVSVKDKSNASKTTTGTTPVADEHQQQSHGHSAGRAGYHAGHLQKEHKHRKRSDHHSHESHEYDEDSEEHEEHEEHDEHEDEEGEEEDHEEEEEEERKKKRDVAGMKHSSMNGEELFKAGPILPVGATNFRRKKSIQWSKYFGLDRKKKSMKKDNNRLSLDVKKRSTNNDDDEEEAVEKEHTKMRDLAYEKLDNMDKKLQSLEDFIIDETIKYTGAHEGVANPDEIRHLKDRVLSRLATAYSLEKMRRALEKLRQSVDSENHLLHNVIEPDSTNDIDSWENQKRLSVKKEKAPVHQNVDLSSPIEKSKEMHSNSMLSSASGSHNTHADDDDDVNNNDDHMKKKKKKSNGYVRYPELPNDFTDFEEELGAGHYEALNDAYLGNKNYMMGSNQCPLIESMSDRCRGVDLLSGDINQELLPICGVHQICYLCGTSQVACDYQYLAEADSICGTNNDCQAAARSVLMILRGSPGPQLGPRECLKNPCLYSAMREIGL